MFTFLLTITSALVISVIGAYFSIIGLSTIFPGSEMSVIIMGSALEVGKVVTVLWLHKNWNKARFLLKSYLCFAVIVLMGITSLGIFGFLSKAHVEHQSSAIEETTLIESFEVKIKKERELISQYEDYINNINVNSNKYDDKFEKEKNRETEKLNFLSKKLKDDLDFENQKIQDIEKNREKILSEIKAFESKPGGLFSNKKKQLEELNLKYKPEIEKLNLDKIKHETNIENFRKNYQEEYKKIENKIEDFRDKDLSGGEDSQKTIDNYNEKIKKSLESIEEMEIEKSKYGEKIRQLEAEIGPLKYFIGFISDTTGKDIESDQAVRLIILIIMIVFDPLAILLVVAAQTSFYQSKENFNNTYVKLKHKIGKQKNEVKVVSDYPDVKKDKMKFILEPNSRNQNSNSSSKEE